MALKGVTSMPKLPVVGALESLFFCWYSPFLLLVGLGIKLTVFVYSLSHNWQSGGAKVGVELRD